MFYRLINICWIGDWFVVGLSHPKGNTDLKHDKTKKTHNYKLIVDPILNKGQKKLYRIDGVIPGDPTSNVIITDPRSRVARLLTKSKQADLLVPQFKVSSTEWLYIYKKQLFFYLAVHVGTKSCVDTFGYVGIFTVAFAQGCCWINLFHSH